SVDWFAMPPAYRNGSCVSIRTEGSRSSNRATHSSGSDGGFSRRRGGALNDRHHLKRPHQPARDERQRSSDNPAEGATAQQRSQPLVSRRRVTDLALPHPLPETPDLLDGVVHEHPLGGHVRVGGPALARQQAVPDEDQPSAGSRILEQRLRRLPGRG